MDNPIFEIKELVCSYDGQKAVLNASALTLQKGSLVFIVGISGSGKSTFVESLGLMNRTIQNGSRINFFPEADQAMQLETVWDQGATALDNFRKKHFSFIFQQTNLMPNFSCGENMIITALMKGESYESAKLKALKYMEALKLDEDVFEKRPVAVSGGQKQRIAFIRAICGEFSVLFGDEPTGNLDPGTARDLIECLKSLLRDNQKTGILVSHDLELATRFGDMIVPISLDKDDLSKPGTIFPENVLVSRELEANKLEWFKSDGTRLEAPRDFLLSLISNGQYA